MGAIEGSPRGLKRQRNGLRRTNEDKRKAVLTLLNDAEWAKWSDREIARRCGVNHELVSRLRPSLAENASEKPVPRTFTTKHGTVTTMRPGNGAHARSFCANPLFHPLFHCAVLATRHHVSPHCSTRSIKMLEV